MNFGKEILAKLLRKFIKDASADQLTLRHMLSGTVELGPGVVFDEVAMQQQFMTGGAPVNFEVKSMVADTVTINMPWAQLSRRSTRVSMGEVKMEVVVHDADEMASVLLTSKEGSAPLSEQEVTEFARTQRNHLLALADMRRRKLDTAKAKKRGLSDFAKVGLRTTVGKMKVTFLRPAEGSLEEVVVVVMENLHFSPCGSDGRPTLDLRDSLIVEPKECMEHLPSTVKVCSANLRACLQSMQVWMPSHGAGSLRKVISASHLVTRMKIYEACDESNNFLIGATGRFLGFRRIFEIGADALDADAKNNTTHALEIELSENDFLTLVTLFADFKASQSMLTKWRSEQPWKFGKRLPTESRDQAEGREDGPSCEQFRQSTKIEAIEEEQIERINTFEEFKTFCATGEDQAIKDDSDEELFKKGQQTFLQLSQERSGKSQNGAKLSTKELGKHDMSWAASSVMASSTTFASSATFAPKKSFMNRFDSAMMKPLRRAVLSSLGGNTLQSSSSERVILKGWLLKRGHVRPLMDSWQERWCELSQLEATPDHPTRGVLRYYVRRRDSQRHGIKLQVGTRMVLHGEIFLWPGCGTQVQTFEEAVVRLSSSEQNKFSVKQIAIYKEFPHGFEVLSGTGKDKGRMYYFAGHAPLEMRRWVEGIRMLLFREKGISGTIEDFVGVPVPRNPLSSVVANEDDSPTEKEPNKDTVVTDRMSQAIKETNFANLMDPGQDDEESEQESTASDHLDQERFASSDSFVSAESEKSEEEDDDEEEEMSPEAEDHRTSRSMSSAPTRASRLSEKFRSKASTKTPEADLALWGNLNTVETMRMSCASMSFKMRFNPQGTDDGTGATSTPDTKSNDLSRRQSERQPSSRAGLMFCFKEMQMTQSSSRRQSLPECLALARLVKASMDEVLRSLQESDGFGPTPSVYRGITATNTTDARASYMEVTSLDDPAPICHTAATADAEGGPMHGRADEVFGKLQNAEMQLRGWRVHCTPEVKTQCGEPFSRVFKQAADIMKAANAKVPKLTTGEAPPPSVSIRLQDMMADVPGNAGASFRVRLPGLFEVDSLESLAKTVTAF